MTEYNFERMLQSKANKEGTQDAVVQPPRKI